MRFALGCALATSACTSPLEPPAPEPIIVQAGTFQNDNARCTLTLDGTTLPGDLEHFAQRLSDIDRAREVRLEMKADTPYRCVGGVLYTLQRLGFSRINLTSVVTPQR